MNDNKNGNLLIASNGSFNSTTVDGDITISRTGKYDYR